MYGKDIFLFSFDNLTLQNIMPELPADAAPDVEASAAAAVAAPD